MEQRDQQGSTAPEHAPIPDDERYRRMVEHMPIVVYTHDGSRPPAPGFDTESTVTTGGHHVGLIGMYERAALIGAQLDVRSSTGAGTTVTLVVPATPTGEQHPRTEDST